MAISSDNKTLGSACMASKWYDVISGKILSFIDRTGLSMVETDGPYGGWLKYNLLWKKLF